MPSVAVNEKKWHALEKKHRAADLDQLLAAPWPGLLAHVDKRVRALARRSIDARVTAALAALFEEMKFVGDRSIAMWETLVARLVRSRDPVALATLLRMRERGTSFGRQYLIKIWLDDAIAKMHKAGVVAAEAPAPALAAAPAPSATDELQVHADALIEKGDPRGEFIALQLAPPTKQSLARQRALLKQHEKKWLGGLAGLMMKGGVVWERGYPTRLVFARVANAIARATGAPELATVRAIDFSRALIRDDDLAAFFTHPVLGQLRVVHELSSSELEQLLDHARGRLPPIEELIGSSYQGLYDRIAVELPKLRVYGEIGGYDPWDDLVASKIWQRIERLVIGQLSRLDDWLEAIAKHPPRALRTLQVVAGGASSLTIDLASGEAELVVDEYMPRVSTDRNVVRVIRARALRGKLDELAVRGLAERLGAKLVLV
jgi:hypothetical protein